MSDPPDLVRLPSRRRLAIEWDPAVHKIAGRTSRAIAKAPPESVRILGKVGRGDDLDALLSTSGQDDEAFVRAVFDRFGWGGFLRVVGAFVTAIETDELLLIRSATFGREPPIFFREVQDGLRFSTEISDFPLNLDLDLLRTWLLHGLWRPRGSTPFAGVSMLEPGGVLSVTKDRIKSDRFWTFTPFRVPRELPELEAQREVEAAIAMVLAGAPAESSISAEAPARALFAAKVARARTIERRSEDDTGALVATSRRIGWPVSLSEIASTAMLLESREPLVSDLGMREALGGTPTALAAWVESIGGAFGTSPGASTLLGALRTAGPIDRRLERSRLASSLLASARLVGNRWKRHLPPTIAERIRIDLPAVPLFESVTGDLFVDRRFAEILEPGLAARHRAIASEREVLTPFLDPNVVELLFSLPRRHFVQDEFVMCAVGGGVPLERALLRSFAKFPGDHPFRHRPRRWFSDLEALVPEDRWLGLGAFLEAWA